jgi:hypoxanthine phosphoribosyltransferase
MIQKEFVRADGLARDSFALAKKIYDSGFRPDSLLVLWRGGTPVGIFIHEFLLYKGVQTYHTAVKAESYTGIGERVEPRIENLDAFLSRLTPESRVLVVDDIFDTGCTLKKVRDTLRARTSNIRIATLYYKIGTSRVDFTPDFYMRMTDRWIVFPHELMGLEPSEIKRKDEFVWQLLHGESC